MANKTYDLLGVVASSLAVTATASSTPVEIKGLNVGSTNYVLVVKNGFVTGTVDGSNYYSVQLSVSDASGGTYYNVGNPVVLPATVSSAQVGFTSEQIEKLIAGADNFKITVTKTGTTATAVTVTAFISKI